MKQLSAPALPHLPLFLKLFLGFGILCPNVISCPSLNNTRISSSIHRQYHTSTWPALPISLSLFFADLSHPSPYTLGGVMCLSRSPRMVHGISTTTPTDQPNANRHTDLVLFQITPQRVGNLVP